MKVGDYVRTKGYITKIDGCTCWKAKNQWYISYKLPDGSEWGSTVTDEFKISPNIIDLIEVGDYVNGSCVEYISHDRKQFMIECEEGYIPAKRFEKYIDTIVTSEQFESMEYRL